MEELNILNNTGTKATYKIGGMSCMSCVAKVKNALEGLPEVTSVQVNKATDSAAALLNAPVSIHRLESALKALDTKYSIRETITSGPPPVKETAAKRTWLETYRPILLVFGYILITTLAIQWFNGTFEPKVWMRHFMAGFFLIFSFFKMMDLSGFADSYMGYDLIAKRWRGWAYIYAFIELGLGISYVLNFNPLVTNIVAFVVMSISILGVLQSVFQKNEIQCACLGAVFNLPMSTVTIIEDALMIAMSGYMIYGLL